VSFFVLAYRRSAGRLLNSQRFEMERDAARYRLSLDLEHLGDEDVEVVVLEAANFDDLRRTHSRYFRTATEMGNARG
jgi:hypothetical protein